MRTLRATFGGSTGWCTTVRQTVVLCQGPKTRVNQGTKPVKRSVGGGGSFLQSYLADVERGALSAVDSQRECVSRLSDLLRALPPYCAAASAYNEAAAQYRRERDRLHAELLSQEDKEAERESVRRQQEGLVAGYMRRFWGPAEPSSAAEIQAQAVSAALRRERRLDEALGPEPVPPDNPTGVYIYGSVGSGKTMLMDRFYEAAAGSGIVPFRRRLHFHAALLEVHHLMHGHERSERAALAENSDPHKDPVQERQKQAKLARLAVRRHLRRRLRQSDAEATESIARSNAAVFGMVAARLIRGADGSPDADQADAGEDALAPGLLCFDEINVNDPFTALALKGVFEALLDTGTVVVATSNRAPRDLNHFGVHEALFEHFRARLQEACDAVEVSCADFRRAPLQVGSDSLGWAYIPSLESEASLRVEGLWSDAVAAEGCTEGECSIPVMFGRHLTVQRAAGGVARFDFRELCDAPKGPSDYYALAQRFHTVYITGIPVMSQQARCTAHHTCLSLTAPIGFSGTAQSRNLARRFIVLIDELYNARVGLVCAAAAPPEELFAGGAGGDRPVLDAEALEQLQFEAAAEGAPCLCRHCRKRSVPCQVCANGSGAAHAELCVECVALSTFSAAASGARFCLPACSRQMSSGSRLRRDVMTAGGVAPVFSGGTATVTSAHLGGLEEKFAFARAISRLYEMSRWVRAGGGDEAGRPALLKAQTAS